MYFIDVQTHRASMKLHPSAAQCMFHAFFILLDSKHCKEILIVYKVL